MTSSSTEATHAHHELGFSRWWLIVTAAVIMAAVSPYQYFWTTIQTPLARELGIPLPQLGVVFSLFVMFQAITQFPAGWWRDRHGPRLLLVIAGILAGGGYIAITYVRNVWELYLAYSIGAIGVGIIYTVAINTALKWFPDRRGLATGVGVLAYAGGSTVFIPYVRAHATVGEYEHILIWTGLIIGASVLLSAVLLRDPPAEWRQKHPSGQPAEEQNANEQAYTWRSMLRTWQFWALYAIFVGVSGAGLALTAKVVAFATYLDLSTQAATLSATVLPAATGLGLVFLGDVSDRLNRQYTMAGSFILSGLGFICLVWVGQIGINWGYTAMVILTIFFWGPLFTLSPSLIGDYYGEQHSSANYALLYTGKMGGGILGGVGASWLVTMTSWETMFLLCGGVMILSGLAAISLRAPSSHDELAEYEPEGNLLESM